MGWIKLDRKIMDNDFLWGCEEPFDRRSAWIDLLLLANHKDKKGYSGSQVQTFARGDVNKSISSLAERWGWSRKKVSNFLNILEQEQMIVQKRTAKGTGQGTTITIVNYSVYQDAGTGSGTGSGTPKEQVGNRSGTGWEHKQEGIEGKEGKEKNTIYSDSPPMLHSVSENARAREQAQPVNSLENPRVIARWKVRA